MLVYSINRIAQLIPIVLILSFIVFMFVEALPGDIIDAMADIESDIDAETRAALAKELGLDQPWYVRYLYWLGDIARGDFGNSLVTRRPVATELLERIPATIYLAAVGIGLSLIIAIPFGTLAAVNRNSPVDLARRHLHPRVLVCDSEHPRILALLPHIPVFRLCGARRRFWLESLVPRVACGRHWLPAGGVYNSADALQHAGRSQQRLRCYTSFARTA